MYIGMATRKFIIPGVEATAALAMLAEIWTDMSRLGSGAGPISWAGGRPCHHERTGQRQRGHARPGHRSRRRVLGPCRQVEIISRLDARPHSKLVYTGYLLPSRPPDRDTAMIPQLLLVMLAGWLHRHQQQVITYVRAENRILKAYLSGRRLRLPDTDRCCLAALAQPLGRTRLKEVATIVMPDTLVRWYRRHIAPKSAGSKNRRPLGRPQMRPQRSNTSESGRR